jgi:preprotein translocase subunit SecA
MDGFEQIMESEIEKKEKELEKLLYDWRINHYPYDSCADKSRDIFNYKEVLKKYREWKEWVEEMVNSYVKII